MKGKLALGIVTVASVVGAIIGGKTVYDKYHKNIDVWKTRFYEKLTQDDIAWG